MLHLAAVAATAMLLIQAPNDAILRGMAIVPAGTYTPLYGTPVRVERFALDRLPVTRGDFLAFVREHREWRRGSVDAKLVDRSYLADWTGDLAPGTDDDLQRPAVNVSWFAAKAYCRAQGKRLPSTAEWERAAAASATRPDATNDPSFEREVLSAYASRVTSPVAGVGRGPRNVFGIADLHNLVWEWTLDFNGRPAHTEAQHAHHMHAGLEAGVTQHVSCASAAIGATSTTNYPAFLRNTVRAGLERQWAMQTLGFRCAAGVP